MGLTKEQAIRLADSGGWKKWSKKERAVFQLKEPRLCMPFAEFHEAVEHVLGRSVWTHEFAAPKTLIAEMEGKIPAPDMAGIIAKLTDMMAAP